MIERKTGVILTSVVPAVNVNTSSFGTGVSGSNCQSSGPCWSRGNTKALTLPSQKNHSENFQTPLIAIPTDLSFLK